MRITENNSSDAERQRFGPALLTLYVILFFIAIGVLKIMEILGLSLAIYVYDAINATACFFLVKRNPKSIWYIPLLINSLLIMIAFFDTRFWLEPFYIPVCIGWVLCAVASIVGALLGRRTATADNTSKSA